MKSPHVHERAFESELVLLDLEGGDYFGLNATGATVWARLSEGLELSRVVTEVAEAHGMRESEVDSDVRALVLELVRRGLLLECDP